MFVTEIVNVCIIQPHSCVVLFLIFQISERNIMIFKVSERNVMIFKVSEKQQ